MAIRFGGRLLQGSDVRAVDVGLRDKGLHREITRAIQRGDSPTSMNNIFRQAGYHFNRFQVFNYLSQRYRPSIFITYADKIAAKYGRRSIINAKIFEQAGYHGDVHVKFVGRDLHGNYQEVTIKVKGSRADSLSELLNNIDRQKVDLVAKYPFDPETVMIGELYLT